MNNEQANHMAWCSALRSPWMACWCKMVTAAGGNNPRKDAGDALSILVKLL